MIRRRSFVGAQDASEFMPRHYSFLSLVSAPHHYCRRRSYISSCLSPHHLSDNYTENRNDVLLSCQQPGRPPTVYPVLIPHGSNSFTDHDRISLCIVAAPPPELSHYEICNHFAQVGFEALDCSDTWSCRSATATAVEHVGRHCCGGRTKSCGFLATRWYFGGLLFTETLFRVLDRTPDLSILQALRHKQTTKQARFCVCHY